MHNPPADEDTASGPQLPTGRPLILTYINSAHPDGLGESAQARACGWGSPSAPSPAKLSLRWSSAYHHSSTSLTVYHASSMLPTPDIEGPRALLVVCPRGIGGGPTLSQVAVAVRRRGENLINRFHTHPFPRIITTD